MPHLLQPPPSKLRFTYAFRIIVTITLLNLTVITHIWIDSATHRTATTLYTPCGLITAIHHCGKLSMICNSSVIPPSNGSNFLLTWDRSHQPKAAFPPFHIPHYQKTRTEQATVTFLEIPHALPAALLTITIGCLAITRKLLSPTH